MHYLKKTIEALLFQNNDTIILSSEKGNHVVNEEIKVEKDSKFIVDSPIASYVLIQVYIQV